MSAHRYPNPTTVDFEMAETPDDSRLLACKCPRCEGDLIRIRRRPIDRMFSLFVSVRRFRCVNLGCIWEGNLRKDSYLKGSDPGAPY